MDDKKRPEIKKNNAQTWLPILIGLFFALMILQGVLDNKTAQVSFSYQLEHLVNLDLVDPQESRKTAVSNNLVTFTGKFRDAKSEMGKKRYQFLSLLEEKNAKLIEKRKLLEEITQEKRYVEASAKQFFDIVGKEIPF